MNKSTKFLLASVSPVALAAGWLMLHSAPAHASKDPPAMSQPAPDQTLDITQLQSAPNPIDRTQVVFLTSFAGSSLSSFMQNPGGLAMVSTDKVDSGASLSGGTAGKPKFIT